MHRILIKTIEKAKQCGRMKQKTWKTHGKKEEGKAYDDDGDGDEEEGAVAICSSEI